MDVVENLKEKNSSQAEKEDKVLDYAFKFSLGSTIFAAIFGVALMIYMVFLIVNK